MTISRAHVQLSVPLLSFSAEDPGTWDPLLERAQLLDRCGVDRLVVAEHVVFGEHLEEYGRPELGGSKDGKQPTGPDGHWLDPLILLSHISALTTNIRLATGVLLAAIRRPVSLAKEAATLDVLSRGRLDIGVGVGWQREEYEAAGLSFEERGRLLDHTLEVCREIWTEPVANHDSNYLHFERIHQMPKPLQRPGVPIWVSGTVNPPVARRLATYGLGWIPWGPAASDLPNSIPQMRHAIEAAGGDPAGLQVVGALRPIRGPGGSIDAGATAEAGMALVEAGVTDLRASFVPSDPSAAQDLLLELAPLVHELTTHS